MVREIGATWNHTYTSVLLIYQKLRRLGLLTVMANNRIAVVDTKA
jgi:hypothetical protein